ncbi:MAG TPA: flagellar export chaperone FliS [Candidatus Aquilonibacter sp.]|nr:flagellar export chaperone FliS [Candidatus Aquilonibacter sp.]
MMRDPVRSYRESAVRGASPLGLIVILYDEMVRCIRKALQAFERGDIETRGKELTHAVEVIGYLQSILDFEKGGEVARNLCDFYNYMRGKLLQIHITPSREGLDELAREFAKVAAAWREAERSLAQPAAAADPPGTENRHPGASGKATNLVTTLEAGLVALER